jgi:hypothetical protein
MRWRVLSELGQALRRLEDSKVAPRTIERLDVLSEPMPNPMYVLHGMTAFRAWLLRDGWHQRLIRQLYDGSAVASLQAQREIRTIEIWALLQFPALSNDEAANRNCRLPYWTQ